MIEITKAEYELNKNDELYSCFIHYDKQYGKIYKCYKSEKKEDLTLMEENNNNNIGE